MNHSVNFLLKNLNHHFIIFFNINYIIIFMISNIYYMRWKFFFIHQDHRISRLPHYCHDKSKWSLNLNWIISKLFIQSLNLKLFYAKDFLNNYKGNLNWVIQTPTKESYFLYLGSMATSATDGFWDRTIFALKFGSKTGSNRRSFDSKISLQRSLVSAVFTFHCDLTTRARSGTLKTG